MLKCGVGWGKKKKKKIKKGCNWDVRLGRERREEKREKSGRGGGGERNKGGQFRNVKCCISKIGVANSNWVNLLTRMATFKSS